MALQLSRLEYLQQLIDRPQLDYVDLAMVR